MIAASFVPPAPIPLARPLSRLQGARRVISDPLSMWTRRHFDEWVLSGKSLLGHITIVSDPASIRAFMVERTGNFVRDDLQLRVLKPSLGEGLFTSDGAAWKVQRRALAGLFTPRTVAGFAAGMAGAATDLVDRWLARGGRGLVQVDREMTQLTLDGLDRSIFSSGLHGDRAAVHEAQAAYIVAMGAVDPLDLFGAPAWLPRVRRIRARPVKAYFDGLVDKIVAERRALVDFGNAPRDLLTLLFEAHDPETGAGLSTAVVRDNVLTFLGAGTETTSSALSWALYLLSQDTGARDRIEAEVDVVLGGRTVTADDLPRLDWTRAVIDETLRLYPTAPLIQRMAVDADELHGVVIPKGSIVVYAPWVLHRHRKLWDRPEVFDPTRFLSPAKEAIDRYSYLPFGAGPRVCIGASFALQQAVITLATIVQRCRLTLRPGADVMPQHRITLRPKGGLPMLVTRREAASA